MGESEEILGAALEGRRDDIVLATKFHNPMGDDPNMRGNSRRWIIAACEASLRRLGTDWIDLYQIHRPDPDTDLDETLGALDDLVRAGRCAPSARRRSPPISSSRRNGSRRAPLRQAASPNSRRTRSSPAASSAACCPTCERYGIGVITWAPLNGGWLTGKYNDAASPPAESRADRKPDHFDYGTPVHDRKLGLVAALLDVAREAGVNLTHLAHAFVLAHPAVTSAILGPRTLPQLQDVLAGVDLVASPDVLDAIDAVVPPGTDVNPADAGYDPPSIADPSARRR